MKRRIVVAANVVEVKSKCRNYKQISSSSSCSSSDSSNNSGRFKNIVVSMGGVLSAKYWQRGDYASDCACNIQTFIHNTNIYTSTAINKYKIKLSDWIWYKWDMLII